jgi:hypothetical protein
VCCEEDGQVGVSVVAGRPVSLNLGGNGEVETLLV